MSHGPIRINTIVDEVRLSNGVTLFIPDIHEEVYDDNGTELPCFSADTCRKIESVITHFYPDYFNKTKAP